MGQDEGADTLTTHQRALELTDWLGHNEIHRLDPAALLAVIRSYLLAERVAALREAAKIADAAESRVANVIRALAEERAVG